MIETVYQFIKTHNLIESSDKVLVGVSGGADSMCLLYILYELKHKIAFDIHVVHMNHMIRGYEAEEDADFVKLICQSLQIPISLQEYNIPELAKNEKRGLEETARAFRYKCFEQVCESIGANKIAVGHHANDQVETVMMNLIRGSGLKGLTGMKARRDKIIRPLLSSTKQDIETFCMQNNIQYRQDSSNQTTEYTRNKLRNHLIPWVEKNINPSFLKRIEKTIEILKEDQEILCDVISGKYQEMIRSESNQRIVFSKEMFTMLSVAVQKRVIRKAIERLKGNLKDIDYTHIEAVTNLFTNASSGAIYHLPGNIQAEISFQELKIIDTKANTKVTILPQKLNLQGKTLFGNIGEIVANIKKSGKSIEGYRYLRYNSLVQVFDLDKIQGEAELRTRAERDTIRLSASKMTKTIKKYMIEKKIPKEERDRIPLVALGNKVLWLIGYDVNAEYLVDDKTQRILTLCFKGYISDKYYKIESGGQDDLR